MKSLFPLISLMITCGIASSAIAQEPADQPEIAAEGPAATTAESPAPAPESQATPTAPAPEKRYGFGALVQWLGKPDPEPPTPPHTGIKALTLALGKDVRHLPSTQNLFWVGVGGGIAAAVHPLDSTANADLSGPTLDKVFKPGAILGQSYTLLPAAVTVYAVGRIKGMPRVSHMGSDLIESLLIAELITQGVKYTVRRERPDGSGANSFPSGHAAGTMAFATALERHFNWHYFVPAYAFATYVAVSRLHDNVHFASDVAAGAAVGIIAGRTVTRHGRENFPIQAIALPGGFGIFYVRQTT
jgi:membrane-associated phospholipid phosphatase